MKALLIVTAVLEGHVTRRCLLGRRRLCPVSLLLGSHIDTPEGLRSHVSPESALFTLGLACWLAGATKSPRRAASSRPCCSTTRGRPRCLRTRNWAWACPAAWLWARRGMALGRYRFGASRVCALNPYRARKPQIEPSKRTEHNNHNNHKNHPNTNHERKHFIPIPRFAVWAPHWRSRVRPHEPNLPHRHH